ncbi:MAG: polyprenyl synthetase family protein [Myxococcota bacterium]
MRAEPVSGPVLRSLQRVCGEHGLATLGERLANLAELVRWDMAEVEKALKHVRGSERDVHQAAHHLLRTSGKRLRPICVALGARMGTGFSDAARELGVAVELVHCATLLHDDVVDQGDTRRGVAAARTVYGNAASIFAGDYLLIDALKRVRRVGVPGALERLLDIIDEMIAAESIQLESRGQIETSAERYFQIVEGKTAALFRWAMFAGARSGGLDDAASRRLEEYGRHLGMAFQLVDDLLDYVGDESKTGKALYADLREGKMTYPLLLARDRDERVRGILELALENDAELTDAARTLLRTALEETGALHDTRELALRHADDATAVLTTFDTGPARTALETVAEACVRRER